MNEQLDNKSKIQERELSPEQMKAIKAVFMQAEMDIPNFAEAMRAMEQGSSDTPHILTSFIVNLNYHRHLLSKQVILQDVKIEDLKTVVNNLASVIAERV